MTERVDVRDLAHLHAAQERVRRAELELAKALGGYEFISTRVAQEFGLTAQDVIEDDGTIRRVAQPNGVTA